LLNILLVFAKILIITLFFFRKTQFFAENCRKSPKIVIITSTPVFTSWTQGWRLASSGRSCIRGVNSYPFVHPQGAGEQTLFFKIMQGRNNFQLHSHI
jgi:hypothetical protein